MSYDAIVIGGGCAGLSAATALVERGARVLVVEARPVLGGRASVVRDPATGERLDNGQHILMGCYDETFRFLRRIGTSDRVRRQAGLNVSMIERSGRPSTLQLPPLAVPFHLLAGVLAWDALSWREKWSVVHVGRYVARSKNGVARHRPDVPSKAPTVREWLVACRQAPRLIELLWEPLALAALNQPIDEAAAETFVEVLARMFGPEADRASLVLPGVPLDELYADPARAWLEARGSEVRTGAPARVRVCGNRVDGVEVRAEKLAAPLVVAATPWFALAQLFPDPPASLNQLLADAAATLPSAIVTVNLWFEDQVLDGELIGLPGRRFQWAFDKGRVFGRDRSHVSLIASGATPLVSWSNDQLIETALQELREALPRAKHATLLHAAAVRERNATFSVAPGQPRRPGTRTPVDGLLLAGDWIDTGLPATIESAVVSGHWAAATA